MKHGVYVTKTATSTTAPEVAGSGIPFYIGAAPVQGASSPAAAGVPVLCRSFEDAKEKLGYSDDWAAYPLCEAMDAHFRLYGVSPAIFCSLLEPAAMKEAVEAADIAVTDGQARLPAEAIHGASLVVKAQGGSGEPYAEGVDYSAFYDDNGELVLELLADGSAAEAQQLNVAYDKVTPSSVTADEVAVGMEAVDRCMVTLGVVPDLLCAPGYSTDAGVAAVMAVKAEGAEGMFHAKAVLDLDCTDTATGSAAIAKKEELGLTDKNQIVGWPMVQKGGKLYHFSTHLCALMAQVDAGNGCPYESPSNRALQCDGMALADGSEVLLTVSEANELNAAGIVTALHGFDGWTAWGNGTACYPQDTAPEHAFIPVARMFDWVGNTLVRTFWSHLDRPILRRRLDSIVDGATIWLNGLVGAGYLYGGRVELPEADNPKEALLAGVVKPRIVLTPPSPAQEISCTLTYDASYADALFD